MHGYSDRFKTVPEIYAASKLKNIRENYLKRLRKKKPLKKAFRPPLDF